ncbi:MAG: hypothetical protein JWM11_4743 [Planctomycetaceae bacterium]|nr:hypothetical protein [Planctomycetaceae bacterium]
MKHPHAIFAVLLLLLIEGCDFGAARRTEIGKIERTENQVKRVAEELDRRTTDTGVYLRVKVDEVQEKDPWGTPLAVSYSQGGFAEMVEVRSAGPDREMQTKDDINAQCIAANFKGIGEGIKKNARPTASNVVKGVVKGTVDGVKESIKEALPFKKKKSIEAKPLVEGETPMPAKAVPSDNDS